MDLRELDLDDGNGPPRLTLPELLSLRRVAADDDAAAPSGGWSRESSVFEGPSTANTGSRVFGGLVLGQVVAAAALTLPEGFPVHHLSGQFVGPADGRAPIRFHVKHVRDGRAFATRTVEATQHDRVAFAGLVSGHVPVDGVVHQIPTLEGLGPDEARTGEEWYAPWPDHARYAQRLELELGLEIRFATEPVHVPTLRGEPTQPRQSVWVRSRERFPDLPGGEVDPVAHAAGLAYLSDLLLLGSALGPHRKTMYDPDVQLATINHGLWLHGPLVRADEWIRIDQSAPWTGNGMAMCRSELFATNGRLVGSVAQESMIRIVRTAVPGRRTTSLP